MTIGKWPVVACLKVMHADSHLGIGFPIQIPTLHKSHQQQIAASDNGSSILTHTAVVKLTHPGRPGRTWVSC